jgi:hypothetical protein
MNEQIGKGPTKHHVGGEKQHGPGQTRMILKPPVPMFEQELASLGNSPREAHSAAIFRLPATVDRKFGTIIAAKNGGNIIHMRGTKLLKYWPVSSPAPRTSLPSVCKENARVILL